MFFLLLRRSRGKRQPLRRGPHSQTAATPPAPEKAVFRSVFAPAQTTLHFESGASGLYLWSPFVVIESWRKPSTSNISNRSPIATCSPGQALQHFGGIPPLAGKSKSFTRLESDAVHWDCGHHRKNLPPRLVNLGRFRGRATHQCETRKSWRTIWPV